MNKRVIGLLLIASAAIVAFVLVDRREDAEPPRATASAPLEHRAEGVTAPEAAATADAAGANDASAASPPQSTAGELTAEHFSGANGRQADATHELRTLPLAPAPAQPAQQELRSVPLTPAATLPGTGERTIDGDSAPPGSAAGGAALVEVPAGG